MAKNIGKIFEEDFKNSADDTIMIDRIPDSALSFSGSSNLRFSRKNPFDYYLYAGRQHDLFALELKSVAGTSISFERTQNESGCIHYHQIRGLLEKSKYDGITAGVIVNFRKIEKTFFIEINSLMRMINDIDKKSFNVKDLESYSPTLIEQEKRRTRYRYNIHKFLCDIENK